MNRDFSISFNLFMMHHFECISDTFYNIVGVQSTTELENQRTLEDGAERAKFVGAMFLRLSNLI